MDSVADDGFLCRRVSPFGNLRIDAYVPLPGAYRSLSRPSSAPDAKAFPLRSFSLNLLVLKNYAGSIRFSVCRNCYPCFPQLLQTFAFCCLACPLLSVQFSMCRPRRRGSRGLRFRGYRKGRESSQALDRSSSSNRNIRFDLRDAGIEARVSAPIGTKFQHLGSLNAETCFQYGGDSRTRTDDPLLAKQVLSQLSYTPMGKHAALSGNMWVYPLN